MCLISFISCQDKASPFGVNELTLKQKYYNGNQIKLNGYWYKPNSGNSPSRQVYFLYRNGVIQGGIGVLDSELLTKEEEFRNGIYYSKTKESEIYWGLFEINDKSIVFEKWYPESSYSSPTAVREGEIINDTTFLITQTYRYRRGKKVEVTKTNETYHFKELSPKPDSTNKYIK